MKKHPKTLSLQDLTIHQQRIQSIVKKINSYSPTFHLNPTYNKSQIIHKIKVQRQQYEDRLFQQNMNIIEKIQSVGAKVDTRRFPPVNLAARQKRKHKSLSLSEKKVKKSPAHYLYKRKTSDQIFQQNMQIIDKLQSIDKKIVCWQDKTLIKSRIIRQKKQKQKRDQILRKFKQISKQMKSIKYKDSISRISTKSPYITQKSRRKQSGTSYQTNANSFITKKGKK